MGENFFFVFSIIPAAAAAGHPEPWRAALGVVFVAGVLFMLLSLAGIRQIILDAVSPTMKNAIAVGIGLFLAFIALQNAGVILKDPGTAVKLNPRFASPDLIVFFLGLLTTVVLHARRVRGSILWGILAATAVALLLRLVLPHVPGAAAAPLVRDSLLLTRFTLAKAVVAMPPSLAPTAFRLDLAGALTAKMWPFILIVLFMVLFDTMGTLIGVAEQAGFIRDNTLPRANRALLSDAAASVVGASLGTSTVTSFIESAAGVEQGGRTGLTAPVTAALFLAALFFGPVIAMVGSYPPLTAPALVVVGGMMAQNAARIDWADPTEALPAFLIIIGIPLSYSIADGIALGFIVYPIVKLLAGRRREAGWLMPGMAVVLIAYFVFVRSRAG
jgi:AGZA family xanthine/uracil permease-like MFS transporter